MQEAPLFPALDVQAINTLQLSLQIKSLHVYPPLLEGKPGTLLQEHGPHMHSEPSLFSLTPSSLLAVWMGP
jgi:hypothetical protein